jgi:hypothetical protein
MKTPGEPAYKRERERERSGLSMKLMVLINVLKGLAEPVLTSGYMQVVVANP